MGPCGESVQHLSWQQLKDDDDNGNNIDDDDYNDDNDAASSCNMKMEIVLSLLDLLIYNA